MLQAGAVAKGCNQAPAPARQLLPHLLPSPGTAAGTEVPSGCHPLPRAESSTATLWVEDRVRAGLQTEPEVLHLPASLGAGFIYWILGEKGELATGSLANGISGKWKAGLLSA